jgi:hypothetical protein
MKPPVCDRQDYSHYHAGKKEDPVVREILFLSEQNFIKGGC